MSSERKLSKMSREEIQFSVWMLKMSCESFLFRPTWNVRRTLKMSGEGPVVRRSKCPAKLKIISRTLVLALKQMLHPKCMYTVRKRNPCMGSCFIELFCWIKLSISPCFWLSLDFGMQPVDHWLFGLDMGSTTVPIKTSLQESCHAQTVPSKTTSLWESCRAQTVPHQNNKSTGVVPCSNSSPSKQQVYRSRAMFKQFPIKTTSLQSMGVLLLFHF